MELVKGVLIILFLVIVTTLILKIADLFVAWYTNHGKPELTRISNNLSENISREIGTNPINASEYDVWEKSKPYLQPLDIALVLAFLASVLGVFIYTRERT